MPTTLTTPEIKQAVTTATVDSWGITLLRKSDHTVDADRSKFVAVLSLRDQNGQVVERRELERVAANLPAGLRTRIAALHTELIAVLRTAELLPAGTDSPDF